MDASSVAPPSDRQLFFKLRRARRVLQRNAPAMSRAPSSPAIAGKEGRGERGGREGRGTEERGILKRNWLVALLSALSDLSLARHAQSD